MKYYLTILTMISILGSLLAAESAQSLDDLINTAMENNLDIRISQQQLKGAQAGNQGSYAGFLPTVNYSWNHSLNSVDSNLTALGLYPHNSFLSISETVFDGARSWFTNRSSANSVKLARINVKSQVEDVILGVKSAYYQFLSALEQQEVAEFSLELADSQLELVQQQYDLQAVSETDLLKARVRRGQAQAQLIQRTQQVKSSRNDVCLAVGGTADCRMEIQRVAIELKDLPEMKSAISILKEQNTRLQLSDINVRSADLAFKTQVSVFMPTVTLGMSYTSSFEDAADQFDGIMQTHPTSTLNVHLPIFSGFTNKARIDQLKYEVLSAESGREQLELQLIAELDDVLSLLDTYHQLIPINEEIIKSAEEDVKLVEKKYHLGSSDILDVLTAQNSLVQAKSDLVRIKHEAKIYEARLEVLLGEIQD